MKRLCKENTKGGWPLQKYGMTKGKAVVCDSTWKHFNQNCPLLSVVLVWHTPAALRLRQTEIPFLQSPAEKRSSKPHNIAVSGRDKLSFPSASWLYWYILQNKIKSPLSIKDTISLAIQCLPSWEARADVLCCSWSSKKALAAGLLT